MLAVMRSTMFALLLGGCGTNLLYKDTLTNGVPNFHELAPRMYATGVPPTPEAQEALRRMVEVPGVPVTRVVLHDAAEADESWGYRFGWNMVLIPLPPEGDRPLTVFEAPKKADVMRAVYAIEDAHARGDVVIWGCVHDRERGNLVTAILGMRNWGWSKDYAWQWMISHGSRIEVTPGLRDYWEDLVQP